MNNLELIDTLIKEKKTNIDVHKNILESDNSRRWFHNKMIKECEEHIEILLKIKTELEEYQKLKEKETPKKPILINNENTCPNYSEQTLRFFRKCCWCGQRIDWSDE